MPIFRGKNFVSAVSDYKDSVRVATRSNINVGANVVAIDGVTLANNDRVLLLGQSNQSQNGIYSWSSATSKLTRSNDADSIFELSTGNRVYVEEGNTFEKTSWTLITAGIINPGVTGLTFAKENRIGTTDISGTYGSATKTLQIVVDETGQVSAVTEYTIDGLPSQTGNSGKYLTTNGTTASWAVISTTLAGLTDVDITGVTDNSVLVYNNSTDIWEIGTRIADGTVVDGGNLDGPDGDSGVTAVSETHSIDDLNDVDTTTIAPTNGQALVWNSATSKWKPSTISGGGAGVTSYNDLTDKPTLFSGSYTDLTSKPTLFSGSYTDLTSKPTIPADVSDLTDTTNLLFSGSYTDLTNKPNTVLTWNIVSSNITLAIANAYFVDTSSGTITLTLPSSAILGDTIKVKDLAGTFGTNALTLARNGLKIQGLTEDLLIDYNNAAVELVYSNSTHGWKIMEL